jgi:hypothetical protein
MSDCVKRGRKMWEDEKSERDIKTAVRVHMGSWFAFIWGAWKATNGLSGG